MGSVSPDTTKPVILGSDNSQRWFRTRVSLAVLTPCIPTVTSDQKTLDDNLQTTRRLT
jgi:hypothetical protein